MEELKTMEGTERQPSELEEVLKLAEKDGEDLNEILEDFLDNIGMDIDIEEIKKAAELDDSEEIDFSPEISKEESKDSDEGSNEGSGEESIELEDLFKESEDIEEFIETVASYGGEEGYGDDLDLDYEDASKALGQALDSLDAFEGDYMTEEGYGEGISEGYEDMVDEIGGYEDAIGSMESMDPMGVEDDVIMEESYSDAETVVEQSYEESMEAGYEEMAGDDQDPVSQELDLGNSFEDDNGFQDQNGMFDNQVDLGEYNETQQDIMSSVDVNEIEEDQTYHVCEGCHGVHEADEYGTLDSGHQKGETVTGAELKQANQMLEN